MHGTTFGLINSGLYTPHYQIITLRKEKITQHFSDSLIAVSKQVLHELTEFYHAPKKKIHLIYNGVDPSFFHRYKKEDAKKFYLSQLMLQ
jgi:glycosyltransferase involved in cell wall biosynthesis